MKRHFLYGLGLVACLAFLGACGINGHNHKELGKSLSNAQVVFGDKTAPPAQLPNKYTDDTSGKTAARIQTIKDKLYPK